MYARMSALVCTLLVLACATANGPVPATDDYPFTGLRRIGDSPAAVQARVDYPELFAAVDTPDRLEEIDTRILRADLFRQPVGPGNYRALWATAVAFFELHGRAEKQRGGGLYFAYSFQATKMIAVPWRPYGELPDPKLRSAILDFYEDVLFGEKPGLSAVRGRYIRIVSDLGEKERDPALQTRIGEMLRRAKELTPKWDR